jgi:hypothetical protein
MKKRRVELTIETHQVWIVREPKPQAPDWCAECGRAVRMTTADEAARIIRQSTLNVYRMVEGGRLHYSETHEGLLLICLDSLLARASAAEAAHRGTDILATLERERGTIRDYGQET